MYLNYFPCIHQIRSGLVVSQTRIQSLFKCFLGWEKIGDPRAHLNLIPNLLSRRPKHINSDWVRVCRSSYPFFFFQIEEACTLAFENIRFSSLFAAGDVSRGGTSARNVPSDEERGETDVFAGYLHFHEHLQLEISI